MHLAGPAAEEALPTLTCPPDFPSSPGVRSNTGGLACTPQRAMGASGREGAAGVGEGPCMGG